MTPHHNYTCNYNYTATIATALHHTTPSICGWGDHCNYCNRSENTTPTTFRSISEFALPSMHHSNSHLLLCPIFETSATALCGTTGMIYKYSYIIHREREAQWQANLVTPFSCAVIRVMCAHLHVYCMNHGYCMEFTKRSNQEVFTCTKTIKYNVFLECGWRWKNHTFPWVKNHTSVIDYNSSLSAVREDFSIVLMDSE